MDQAFSRIAHFIAHRRFYVGLLQLAITCVALVGYFDPRLESISRLLRMKSATNDTDSQDSAVAYNPFRMSQAEVVLVAQADNFFLPSTTKILREIVEELERLPQVEHITWIDSIPSLNIFGIAEPLLPNSNASLEKFAAAREKALKHPLVLGRLLSEDQKTMLLLVDLEPRRVYRNEDVTSELTTIANDIAARYPDSVLHFQVTGMLPAMIAAVSAHEANQVKYQLIGYGMIFAMAIVLFRGWQAVLIVGLAPAIGMFWTVGAIRFFQFTNNPLIDVVLPILVSLVGLTDGVHLLVQIRKLRSQGESVTVAAERGLAMVGLACFLTSLTTAIGFGSLMLADSEWVRQFGMCCTVGVALSFLAVVTVIPLACASPLGKNVHQGLDKSLIDQNLKRLSLLVGPILRHRVLISSVTLGACVLFSMLGAQLTPDQRQVDNLPIGDEATKAYRHVDQAFRGIEFSQVEIRWTNPAITGDQVLSIAQEVEQLVASHPLLGHPLSAPKLIRSIISEGSNAISFDRAQLLPPPLLNAYFDDEAKVSIVNFRIQDLGIAQYGPVFRQVEQGLRELEKSHPEFQLKLTGSAVRRWRVLYQIVVDLAKSLGSASVIIFGVLVVVFRSLRMGLISIIPNFLPLALTAAYLWLSGHNLEVVVVCNFTICLGIAVDDTIHFLTRFRESQSEGYSTDEAIRQSFENVGSALIMTTLVLVAGFSLVMFSDSRDHRIFATMGVITLSAALVCDLIALPALLSLFAPPAPSVPNQLREPTQLGDTEAS